MSSTRIEAIDKKSVARICSGQVVVDLASAVKELVENALDAGATQVEVKLKDYGAELIEVSDNGSGISEDNYVGLALKYHTSKLRSFDDLLAVETYGFRGEALSSLCELSARFTVITRTQSQGSGRVLEFDTTGNLASTKVMARPVGTTVTVQQLFEALPVRRREFKRNIKKQFPKMVRILQAYALIRLGVRLSCVNFIGDKRHQVLNTQSGRRLTDNITCIFGVKFMATLQSINVEVSWHTDSAAANESDRNAAEDGNLITSRTNPYTFSPITQDDSGVDENIMANETRLMSEADSGCAEEIAETKSSTRWNKVARIVVTGLVSKPGLGGGRSDSDRQFFFLNQRPVDMPKVARILNDAWRKVEVKTKPACVLNVSMPAGTYDVNVTPDKREIILAQEGLLLERLAICLENLWGGAKHTFSINQGLASCHGVQELFGARGTDPAIALSAFGKSEGATLDEVEHEVLRAEEVKTLQRENIDLEKESGRSVLIDEQHLNSEEHAHQLRLQWVSPKEQRLLDSSLHAASARARQRKREVKPHDSTSGESNEILTLETSSTKNRFSRLQSDASKTSETTTKRHGSTQQPFTIWSEETDEPLHQAVNSPVKRRIRESVGSDREARILVPEVPEIRKSGATRKRLKILDGSERYEVAAVSLHSRTRTPFAAFNDAMISQMEFDMTAVHSAFRRNYISRCTNTFAGSATRPAAAALKECSLVGSVDDSTAARALSRVLCKGDFDSFEVIGQFNLGFIIARSTRPADAADDLFILDQHACDEKYRFEQLQQRTAVHSQPLLRPLVVEATAAEEIVITDNVDVFKANGLQMQVDESAPPGRRIQLTAVPFSKHVQFGAQEVHELASLLSEDLAPGAKDTLVLPKLASVYASRACRGAVMIGTPLSITQMQRIVKQMGGMEQPWNCPHGRPTMRHLVDLQTMREKRAREHDNS